MRGHTEIHSEEVPEKISLVKLIPLKTRDEDGDLTLEGYVGRISFCRSTNRVKVVCVCVVVILWTIVTVGRVLGLDECRRSTNVRRGCQSRSKSPEKHQIFEKWWVPPFLFF